MYTTAEKFLLVGASAQVVESYNVNVTTTANNAEVENPGVFEGIELPFNTYKQSYQRTTYWKFELDESAEVNFLFNAPTNKNFSAVVYNENGVYATPIIADISNVTDKALANIFFILYSFFLLLLFVYII